MAVVEGENRSETYALHSCCLILPLSRKDDPHNPDRVGYQELLPSSFLFRVSYADYRRVITMLHGQITRKLSFNTGPPCTNLAQTRFGINSHSNPFFHLLSTN